MAKTAWILAMVGFLRPSYLARMDLEKCSVSEDKVLHLCVVAPNETRQGSRITKTIIIHPHPDLLLCPVTAYSAYVSWIASHIRRTMTHVGKPEDAPVPKARALDATLAAQAGILSIVCWISIIMGGRSDANDFGSSTTSERVPLSHSEFSNL
ncbi:hypothetical protein CU097_011724 [Rhizopus azygosporus]|uniref:Tyr recombinase domain-containing protein n=1 Tax=Rhizopus azygosporus TaxID=86630 RepID=A0A367JPG9_RHIAZ|nr:hypothetical protein CU097_011724 [Rhizopus azygosporus]